MAMRLERENVMILEHKLISEAALDTCDKEDAERMIGYIEGISDMAQAVMEAIITLKNS